GPEFFHPPGVYLGEVEVTVRIHAHPVDIPERSRPLTLTAPRVLVMPLDVVLDDFRRVVVGDPNIPARVEEQDLRRRRGTGAELIEVLAVLVEHLDAVVFAIGDVDLSRG